MKLQIVTPLGPKVDEDDVTELVATGTLGELGIKPGHVPLITSLKPGRLIYEKDGNRHTFAADVGFLDVTNDTVHVLTETFLAANEIDVDRAERARARAEDALKDPKNQTPDRRPKFEAALDRANCRLTVAREG